LEESARGSLVRLLDGEIVTSRPIWLMRQAGRYLPEYRESRTRAGSFWNLCTNPENAAEVTLQPLRRFDFDAAIIFSDILMVPYALGKRVTFEEGSGPRLETTCSPAELCVDVDAWLERLAPVYEAVTRVAAVLPKGKDLIGFAGGPWTLAAYMAQGQGSPDQAAAKLWAYCDKAMFCELLRIIAECVVVHLCAQIEAGATVVQLFDSWAGGLNDSLFREYVVAPSRYIVEELRRKQPTAKIIGFPRGATETGYLQYQAATRVDGLSIDSAVSVPWAVENLGVKTVLQGNLDPFVLLAGGAALQNAAGELLAATRGTRHIVNLGHGILPETPVTNVAELVRLVRSAR
jgi:uroporphyrinogen decarboxylase